MGKIDLPLIMKIVALVNDLDHRLICCAVAVGVNVADHTSSQSPRPSLVSNSVIYSVGAYIIILFYFLIWSIVQDDVDKKFAAIILICGFIWTVGAGIGVIIFKVDYDSLIHDNQLIGGILALAGGIVMLVDGVHNLGVF